MATPESTAVDVALTRVIVTLQAKLTAALAAAEVAIAGLPLDAPAAGAYFMVGSADYIETVVPNHLVSCFVYQAGPSEIESHHSGNALTYSAYQTFEMDVVIAYGVAPYTPFTRAGKTTTGADIMALRGHRYNAGVINALRQYAADETSIEDIRKVSDFAGAVKFNEEGQAVRGYATSTWEVFQNATVFHQTLST